MERETLRYLGYGNSEADPETLELVRECLDLLCSQCRPRRVSVEVGVDVDVFSGAVRMEGGVVFRSMDLARALAGCRRAVILGGTLGIEADRLLRREAGRSISRGAVLQAAATAVIEDWADKWEAELRTQMEQAGTTLGQRFSPGYGDFPIAAQEYIFKVLQCEKKIGLTLTDEMIMVPTKSVTAIMAVGGECGKQLGCEFCNKADCLYRRKD